MSRMLLVLGLGVALVAPRPVRAQENPEMQAAKSDLESARQHLQAAAHDYDGHRKKAVELVTQALAQVRDGLATVAKHENKVEHKENQAQKKADALKAKDAALKAK